MTRFFFFICAILVVSSNSKRETRLHWEDILHFRIRSVCSGGKIVIIQA